MFTYIAILVCGYRLVCGLGSGAKGQDVALILLVVLGAVAIAIATAVTGAMILAGTKPGFAHWFQAHKILGTILTALATVPIGFALGITATFAGTILLAFYCEVLGFVRTHAVPDAPPLVFAGVQSGPIEIFFNAPGPAMEEYPALAGKPIGGTFTMFIEVAGIEKVYSELESSVKVTMPLETKWYGVTEFAFEDPDGYVITFAERQ